MALKKCKECGEEISSSAKVCPKCGKKQGGSLKIILIIIAIIIVIIAIASGGNKNTSKTTLNSGTTSETPQANTKTSFNVGEIWESTNHAIKYVSVDADFKGYNQYADIKAGHKVVKADFEAENLGSTDFYFSAYEFTCYADGYDCESFWSVDESGFSSTLSTGKKAKGSVYFQVPANAEHIVIEYEDNLWSSNKIEFVVK